jgi:ribonuclease HI
VRTPRREAERPAPAAAPQPRLTGRIDGGARGNPGPAGIGLVLEEPDAPPEEYYAYLGIATNNVAEYVALLVLLVRSAERRARELVVRSDSELLVKQMLGTYRVKNPRLQTLHAAARRMARRIPRVEFLHVPREENREADRLANRAMDERDSSAPLPPEVAALLEAPEQTRLSLGEGG